jgi:hypothetical protein
MEQKVAYWMMIELNGLSHIYESTISDCFTSVCHKYNVSEEEQQAIKEPCIERVTKTLSYLYS